MEVKYVWGRRFRLSTLLYVLCRYALLANVVFLVAKANLQSSSCDTSYKFLATLSLLGRGAVIFTLSARTWAIYSKNRYVLAYLIVTGGTCIVLGIIHIPLVRCDGKSSIIILGNLIGISMMLVEYSAAILTFIRSYQAYKIDKSFNNKEKGFIYLMFEQGVAYFSIVSVLTTIVTILDLAAPDYFLQRMLCTMILPLSCMLNARFILYLRAWEHKRSSDATVKSDGYPNGPLQFAAHPGTTPEESTGRTSLTSLSLFSFDDFGEDPVSVASRNDHDPEDLGEGPSTRV